MAAYYSNISARFKACGSVYFLFIPLAGLVVYNFLFTATKASPLLVVSRTEQAFALFTALFFAFVAAAVLTATFSFMLSFKSALAQKLAKRASLAVFAALATVLALVVLENFTYTMFKNGIKNTDGTLAKLFYLGLAGAIFYFFVNVGETYRAKVRAERFVIANIFVAVAALCAILNMSGNITARAASDLVVKTPYNVLILSSDGIDAARTSLYGYERKTTPFIDSIAGEMLVARHAYPNNGHTTGAVTALLTGILPTTSKVVFPPDTLAGPYAHRSLPRLLRREGYYANNIAVPHYADASSQNMLEAFDVNNNRSMLSATFPISFNYTATNWFFDRLISDAAGITQDVLWIHEMPNPYAQVDGQNRGYKYGFNDLTRLHSVLAEIRKDGRPFFVNSHFLGTHGPFFNPSVTEFSSASSDRSKPWSRDLYDDAVLSFDHFVKRVYRALEEEGKLEKTILVIMSDHGISHDPRKKIPLMIRFPGRKFAGRVIDENVQVIDIAPTIIDFLGASAPAWMEGDSLISGPLASDREIFSASIEKIGFVPGVGVTRRDMNGFGKMDYFYLIHCNHRYRLSMHDDSLDVSADPDGGDRCTGREALSGDEAKRIMLRHLADRYPAGT